MLTELTFAILKYGFLVLLWIFVACTVRSLYRDVETLSPRKSRAHRRKELGSTNGTVVNQQRLNAPMILGSRVPVRIGATTFELR